MIVIIFILFFHLKAVKNKITNVTNINAIKVNDGDKYRINIETTNQLNLY